MRVRHWLAGAGRRVPAPPLESLQRVLISALGTPFYLPLLQDAGLGARRPIRSLRSVREALERLPLIDAREWMTRRAELENPRESPPGPARALPPFPGTRGIDVRGPGKDRRPGVVAGSLQHLLRLAPYPTLQGIVVLSAPGDPLPGPEERELLWRRLEVPLFEQWVGPDGEVIAAECEAHDGLHTRPGGAIFETAGECLAWTSLTSLRFPALRIRAAVSGRLESGGCACGRPGPRLVALAPLPEAAQPALTTGSCSTGNRTELAM